MITITPLTSPVPDATREALITLLMDAVINGASVNFVAPMTRSKAEAWWDNALISHARGERVILVAESADMIVGSVQLIPAPQENQAFRADIAKLLVLSHARRRGIGRMLMNAIETEALKVNRTLLTLDTETESDGERLYEACGWTKFGAVPGFATRADGSARQSASFFYKEISA